MLYWWNSLKDKLSTKSMEVCERQFTGLEGTSIKYF